MKKIHFLITGFLAGFTMLFVILFMYMFRKNTRFFRIWWSKFLLRTMGVELEIIGLPSADTRLFAINHRSLLDIVILEVILSSDTDPCWIAKKEIADIPIYGRILDAPKMITIDRENSREIVKLLKVAKERLDQDRVLMIFPEGTRNRKDGLIRFKQGAKVLSEKLDLKVQPVVISKSDDHFSTKNGITRGVIKVEFLEPIDEKIDGWYEKMYEDMLVSYEKIGDK